MYVYNSLYSILSAGYDVQMFPYDWRRDIGGLSEDLFTKVQAMHTAHPTNPVAIVAHSMGGLIVQEMLHRHAPDLMPTMGPIITLGTPFLGSVDTYLYFQGWKDFIPIAVNGYTMSQIGGNWPSSYELLPQWDNFVQLCGKTIPYTQVYSGQPTQSLPPWAVALPRQSALPIAYNLWAEPAVAQYHLNNAQAHFNPCEFRHRGRWSCIASVGDVSSVLILLPS